MTIHRSQESLIKFYTEALAAGENTPDELQAPIAPAFAELLDTLPLTGHDRTALDIGYGAGTYSIALAQHGFRVHSVDRVPAALFTARLPATSWARRIHVAACRIEDYPIRPPLGVIVAKDVLHYLSRRDVHAVLAAGIGASVPGSCHYMRVFTNICRTTHHGDTIRIDGELGCSASEFIATLTRLYRGWSLTHTTSPHTERDRRTGRPHFQATRLTVVAQRAAP